MIANKGNVLNAVNFYASLTMDTGSTLEILTIALAARATQTIPFPGAAADLGAGKGLYVGLHAAGDVDITVIGYFRGDD